jgi:NAD(P)-dependent dehydrogenase (short-subunit alcohol dehydrogenase family)
VRAHTGGKTAFITGGAAGIGLGVARALGREGVSLILADIEPDTLEDAARGLREQDYAVATEVLDVADADAYGVVARRVLEREGHVDILFNNAGVGSYSLAGDTPMADWRWVLDVNVLGVAHGVECFLPAMLAAGSEAHIINTASMAGQLGTPGMGPYCASKFAVVGYSETLRLELAESSVGVSVLCPAWVKTRIAESHRNHPAPHADEASIDGMRSIHAIIEEEGITVDEVAARVVEGIRDDTFYLFTHPEFWPPLEERLAGIQRDYRRIVA